MNPAAQSRFAADPGPEVQAVFERIGRERMADVPLCNRALAVEALAFVGWDGLWVGVVITPWAMNLMVLPGGNPDFAPLRVGRTQAWRFPSGEYLLMGSAEPGLGDYHYTSLFSPMDEFSSQAAAREVAQAALEALLQAPAPSPAPGLDRRGFLRRALGQREPA
jgi:[NiFe] hydrogenase assembly HybE family chaperone